MKFGAYWTIYFEWLRYSCSQWHAQNGYSVTPTPLIIWQLLITFHVRGLKNVHAILRDILIKSVGICWSTTHVKFWFPVASRWCYEYGRISACEWAQARTLIIHKKFDAYWTKYNEVTIISFFIGKCSKWQTRHAHTVTPKWKILITFEPERVHTSHSNFHENLEKSIRGVCYSTQCVNLQKWAFKMDKLPVEFSLWSQETFL